MIQIYHNARLVQQKPPGAGVAAPNGRCGRGGGVPENTPYCAAVRGSAAKAAYEAGRPDSERRNALQGKLQRQKHDRCGVDTGNGREPGAH